MAKHKKPKWVTNVAKAMERICPPNCPGFAEGTEFDDQGNVTRTFSCRTYCPVKRR